MPRSSRHKSSKRSSREAREHSDSEKDSSLKERKGKEESRLVRASKDFGSGEKRKLDSKDGKESRVASGNGEYMEDYSSSKRRKERSDGRPSDRWNGGEDDYYEGGDGSKKSLKASGDAKSKRRDEGVGMDEEREELKKSSSSGKNEARHRDRDLSRKEGREIGGNEKEKEKDRERKSTDGRSERLGSNADHRRAPKQVIDITDINAQVDVGSPEPHNLLERRMRKKRDGSDDVDKYEDVVGDIKGRKLSSRDDSGKDGKLKDETRRDERYKDKHLHMDRQRDERLAKDYHPSNRSVDKQIRDEKDTEETQQKRSKLKDSERKEENVRDYDREWNHDSELRDRERDRGSNCGHDFDHDWDQDQDHDRSRDRDRRRDSHRDRDRVERDRDRGHDYDRGFGGSHHDDRTVKHRDASRGKRGSPECQYDINYSQPRSVKACFSDMENKALTSDRNVLEVSKRRSQSRPAYTDKSSNKWGTSPSSNSHVPLDDNRHINPEDLKYRDFSSEQKSKALSQREVSVPPELSERGSKYRSMEKSTKIDDLFGEQSIERSSSKASPLGTKERSPSPPSNDRRYMNRSGVRRSLDIEETGWKSGGDFRTTEERPNLDLQSEKPMDDASLADTSFYNRTNQGNSSSFLSPHPAFRSGLDSPGSLEDDGRVNSNARYRRSSDPNMGRAHGSAWRGVPNWASPVPNGFIPFQHGPPPSGGFQGMMPQFPGPLFGVRPSMEINHSGMPYHMADADRFSSHLRPLGWHNLMDGSGPSHVHGWDGCNGVFRDEPHLYCTTEWDQNRHPLSGCGWESSPEVWKGQNGETKRALPSPSHKDDYPVPASEDDVGQARQLSNYKVGYNQGISGKLTERRLPVTSPVKQSTPKNIDEKTPDHSKSWRNDVSHLSYYYLSKLDISAELVHPEVHNRFMNLLGTQQSAVVDDDTSMHIILEDGSRAGLKASNTKWISSHFPLIEGSVFERAMDLYNKQKMETRGTTFLKEGMLVPFLASNQENMEEQLDHKEEKVEDQVITTDAEMRDSSILNKDPKNIESVSSAVAVEKLGEFVSTPAKEQNNINLHQPKLEASVQNHKKEEELGEMVPTSCGEKMEAVDTASPSATPLSPIGDSLDGSSKLDGDHSMSCAEKGVLFADASKGPLCIPDGSSIACEDMISESNESVILSRIHHSPESTH